MKYTDVYTANLSALTGGTSSGATAYESQAIAETNGSDELADAQSKVDAAMSTLATASEHTGKATALRQIVLRFSDQFEGGASSASGSDGDGSSGDVSSDPVTEAQALTGLVDSQSQSFYGKTRVAQAKRKADAARKQAKAAQQQQSQHSIPSNFWKLSISPRCAKVASLAGITCPGQTLTQRPQLMQAVSSSFASDTGSLCIHRREEEVFTHGT